MVLIFWIRLVRKYFIYYHSCIYEYVVYTTAVLIGVAVVLCPPIPDSSICPAAFFFLSLFFFVFTKNYKRHLFCGEIDNFVETHCCVFQVARDTDFDRAWYPMSTEYSCKMWTQQAAVPA